MSTVERLSLDGSTVTLTMPGAEWNPHIPQRVQGSP